MPKKRERFNAYKNNKKKLSISEVIKEIVRLKRALPPVPFIPNVRETLEWVDDVADAFRGDGFLARRTNENIAHALNEQELIDAPQVEDELLESYNDFVREENDMYNVPGEGDVVEISDNYKSCMINAIKDRNLNVITEILSIHSCYAKSSTYLQNEEKPIYCVVNHAFDAVVIHILVANGASLLERVNGAVPLNTIICYASVSGGENYNAANKLLINLKNDGHFKREDFSNKNTYLYNNVERLVAEYNAESKLLMNLKNKVYFKRDDFKRDDFPNDNIYFYTDVEGLIAEYQNPVKQKARKGDFVEFSLNMK